MPSENILNVGMTATGYVEPAKTITKANLDMMDSANKANTALAALEGGFNRAGSTSRTSMSAARSALNELKSPIDNLKENITGIEHRILRIGATVVVLRAVGEAVSVVSGFFKEGIRAVDDYQQVLIGITASLTQIAIMNNKDGMKSIPQMYQESARYAAQLAEQMRIVDIHSSANYNQIMDMLQVYTSTGHVLDVNNKKQMEGFTALSNAIPMLTKGQDVTKQMQTEMRAFATGNLNRGAMIANMVDQFAKADGVRGGLKELIKIAEESNKSVLEISAKYMQGFTAAGGDIAKSFTTAKTSFETAIGVAQRKIFSPIVNDFTAIIQGAIKEVDNGTGTATSIIRGAWDKVRDSLFIVTEGLDSVGNKTKEIALKPEVIEGFKSVAEIFMTTAGVLRDWTLAILNNLQTITQLSLGYLAMKIAVGINTIALQAMNVTTAESIAMNQTIVPLVMLRAQAEEAASRAAMARRIELVKLGVTEVELLTTEQFATKAKLEEASAEGVRMTRMAEAEAVQRTANAAKKEALANDLLIAENNLNLKLSSRALIEAEFERNASLLESIRLKALYNEAVIAGLETSVAELKIKRDLVSTEASIMFAKQTAQGALIAENTLKQEQIAIDIKRMEIEVEAATVRQETKLRDLAFLRSEVEYNLSLTQAEIARYEGTGTHYIQMVGWKKQEAAALAQLEAMTVQQIALEENLALSREKAAARIGLNDAKDAQIALTQERVMLQEKLNALTANTVGLQAKEVEASAALGAATRALAEAKGESAVLSEAAYAAETRLLEIRTLLGENAVRVTEAQLALNAAYYSSLLPAATIAAEKHNAALALQGITTGAVTGTEYAKVRADYALLVSQDAVLGTTTANTAMTALHSEALLMDAARTAALTAATTSGTLAMGMYSLAMETNAIISKGLLAVWNALGGWLMVVAGSVYVVYKAFSELNEMEEKYENDRKIRNSSSAVGVMQERARIAQEKIDAIKLASKPVSEQNEIREATELEKVKGQINAMERQNVELLAEKARLEREDVGLKTGNTIYRANLIYYKEINDQIERNNQMLKKNAEGKTVLQAETERTIAKEAELALLQKAPDSKPKKAEGMPAYNAAAERSIDNAYIAYVMGFYKDQIALKKEQTATAQAVIDESYRRAEMSQKEHIDRTFQNQKAMLDADDSYLAKELANAVKQRDIWKNRTSHSLYNEAGEMLNPAFINIGAKPDKEDKVATERYNNEKTALNEVYKLQQLINSIITKQMENREKGHQLDTRYLSQLSIMGEANKKVIEDQNIEILKMTGNELEAFTASKATAEYKRTVLDVEEEILLTANMRLLLAESASKAEQDAARQEVADAEKRIAQRERLNELQRKAIEITKLLQIADSAKLYRDYEQSGSAFAANQVGRSAATGYVTDEYTNAKAVEADRHKSLIENLNAEYDTQQMIAAKNQDNAKALYDAKVKMLDIERQINEENLKNAQNTGAIDLKEQVKAYDALAGVAQKTYPKITAFATASHLATKEYAKEQIDNEEDGLKKGQYTARARKQLVQDYTGLAGELFTNLANTQDQTSKAGFESAKAFNIAAAIMNTASAVMAQLSIPGPAGWAMAAAAAALGVVQIAKIESTSYGGGSSDVAAPSGSYGAANGNNKGEGRFTGAAALSTGGVGSSASEPLTSAIQKMTIAARENTNALKSMSSMLALGKAADSGVFRNGAPGQFTALSPGGEDSAAMKGLKWGSIVPVLGNFIGLAVGSIVDFFSGSSWRNTGAGITAGVSGGNFAGSNYIDQKKSGGLFSGDKYRTTASPMDNAISQWFQTQIDSIKSNVSVAATILGTTTTALENVNITATKIATAGRSTEDIQKDIDTWINKVNSDFAKTIVGLDKFTHVGESAGEAFARLANAALAVGKIFDVTGNKMKATSLEAADLASSLVESYGGIDKLQKANDDFIDALYTENAASAYKAAAAYQKVKETFDTLGITIPKTNVDFIKLRQGLDTTSESGLAVWKMLTDVGPAFAEMTEMTEKLSKATKDFNDDLTSRTQILDNGNSDLFSLRIKQEDEVRKAIEDGMDVQALQIVQDREWARAVTQATTLVSKSVKTLVESSKDAVMDMLDAQIAVLNAKKSLTQDNTSPERAYRQATEAFNALEGKKDLASVKALPEAVNNLIATSKAYNATGVDFQNDFKRAIDALDAVAPSGNTIPEIEKQTNLLADIKKAIEDGNTDANKLLGPSGTLASLIGTWSEATKAELLAKQKQAAVETYNRDVTAYTEAVSAARTSYTQGKIDADQFTASITPAYNQAVQDRQAAINIGGSPQGNVSLATLSDTDVAAFDKHVYDVAHDFIYKINSTGNSDYMAMVKGLIPKDFRYDVNKDGKIDETDRYVWSTLAQGFVKWGDMKKLYPQMQVFAKGGISNQPAIFGEAGWEAAVPLPDGRSIPVTVSHADNYNSNDDALLKELQALRKQVALLEAKIDTTNRINEAGFETLSEQTEEVKENTGKTERNTRFGGGK